MKLLIGFALVTAVSTAVQFFTYNLTKNYTLNRVSEFQKEKADAASVSIDTFFRTLNSYTDGIGKTLADNSFQLNANVGTIITYIFNDNTYVKRIAVLNPLGKELLKYDRSGKIPDEKLNYEIVSEQFNAAVSGRFAITKVYYVENDPSPYIDIYSPVSSQNNVRNIIKMQISLATLWNVISGIKVGNYGYAYVVDQSGSIIAHPNQSFLLTRPDVSTRRIVATILNGQQIALPTQEHIYINEKNTEVVAEATVNTLSGWIIVFEQPTAEAFAYINLLRNLSLLTAVGSVVFLLLISYLLSSNMTDPIRKLEKAVRVAESGKFDTQISIRSGDEIEDLAEAFNTMLSNLHNSIQAIENKDSNIKQINEELELEKEFISAEKNKLSVILSGISDAVVAVDLHRNIILFSAAAEKLFGYKAADVLTQPVDKIMSVYEDTFQLPPEVYCPVRADEYEGTLYGKKEVKIICSNGKQIFADLTTSKIREGTHVNLGAIMSVHDVTGEHQLEEMKLDFVSMAAHELRTPLTSIKGYLSVFMEENGHQFTGEQHTFLNRINIATGQLVALVENLLNVTRIERGVFTVHLAKTDWLSLSQETFATLKDRASEKNIEYKFIEPSPALPPVMADKLRITEVLTNLLANAISYTSPGGTVTISFEYFNNEVITHITDTGEGIPPEALPHLFTKFFRVSGKLAQGSKGTGLGLYISRAIVEMHKGKIWVKSTLGKGSTFSFSLPVVLGDYISGSA